MAFGEGKAAVLDKPVAAPMPGEAKQKQPEKPYHVLLFNDVSRLPVCVLPPTNHGTLCLIMHEKIEQTFSLARRGNSGKQCMCRTMSFTIKSFVQMSKCLWRVCQRMHIA
jgi:hypothetical protein